MEIEVGLLADVYSLLLTDIRRNRARRLATQARTGMQIMEDQPDDEADYSSARQEAASETTEP
jgi:hypothetical protein